MAAPAAGLGADTFRVRTSMIGVARHERRIILPFLLRTRLDWPLLRPHFAFYGRSVVAIFLMRPPKGVSSCGRRLRPKTTVPSAKPSPAHLLYHAAVLLYTGRTLHRVVPDGCLLYPPTSPRVFYVFNMYAHRLVRDHGSCAGKVRHKCPSRILADSFEIVKNARQDRSTRQHRAFTDPEQSHAHQQHRRSQDQARRHECRW